jgi:hypothetical protein
MSFPTPPTQPPPVVPPATAPAGDKLSRTDIWSIIITVLFGVTLVILAYISASRGWVLGLAVTVGGVGGLVHEIAQSGGKILFFERKADGFYLGSAAGAVLGAVAGLLAVRGLIIDPAASPGTVALIYDSLLAGMALKGVTEAAGGQAIPAGSGSLTPSQAMATAATVDAIVSGTSTPPLPPALGPLPAALSQPLGPVPDVLPPDI